MIRDFLFQIHWHIFLQFTKWSPYYYGSLRQFCCLVTSTNFYFRSQVYTSTTCAKMPLCFVVITSQICFWSNTKTKAEIKKQINKTKRAGKYYAREVTILALEAHMLKTYSHQQVWNLAFSVYFFHLKPFRLQLHAEIMHTLENSARFDDLVCQVMACSLQAPIICRPPTPRSNMNVSQSILITAGRSAVVRLPTSLYATLKYISDDNHVLSWWYIMLHAR